MKKIILERDDITQKEKLYLQFFYSYYYMCNMFVLWF